MSPRLVCVLLLASALGCSKSEPQTGDAPVTPDSARGGGGALEPEDPPPSAEGDGASDPPTVPLADVTAVDATGQAGAYTFAVTVRSPDTGCDRYADYWEVVTEEGALVYRRILAHSHTEEQPFTRTGGPVDVTEDQTVVVRAHMSVGGYGGEALRGSVAAGFSAASLDAGFAASLETALPQPDSCAF